MRRQQPFANQPLRHGATRWPHVIIAGLIALLSVISYFRSFQTNPVTGETQRVSMSIEQEIALGRQAAAKTFSQYGGRHPDEQRQLRVERVGRKILEEAIGEKNPYPFEFHVLRDERAVNAFALPGGQVFITAGLLDQLQTEGQLAAVLAHEIGHVVERHAAERLAKAKLSQGLTGAIVIAAYDPDDPKSRRAAEVAIAISHLNNLKYSREDELESDRVGVVFMTKAGYDPNAMIRVMEILQKSAVGKRLEFFRTHPEPERRIEQIETAIAEIFPEGNPKWLIP